MAEWRLLRGWSVDSIRLGLAKARWLPLSFSARWEEMTLAEGWNHVESRAVVARERPGTPEPSGTFIRATHLLEGFKFSDPRVVVGHFDARQPLLGRAMLLELRALGLRFLCPVQVADVRLESPVGETRFGYSYVTLDGHIECGREWFVLSKDHATGEVRFHIEAKWREGQFPNLWSRAGFALVGRRYQRAWHRLAHLRMRRLLSEGAGLEPHRIGLRHEGPRLEDAPIQLLAQRGRGRRKVDVEQEVEHVRENHLGSVVGLSALAGFRTFTPLAVLAVQSRRRHEPLLLDALTRGHRPTGLTAVALGELAGDKVPGGPNRTAPLLVAGRCLAGALVGLSFATRARKSLWGFALIGMGAAAAGTFASYTVRERIRRATGLPSAVLGAVEDALVVGSAAALANRMR